MADLQALVLNELNEASTALQQFMSDNNQLKRIVEAAEIMANSVQQDGKIISCGNGGSMCDAMHFAEELTGNFRKTRQAIPAIAIADPSYLTCVANDYGFDAVFSRYIEAFGKKGDVFLAISTSGNSANILKAAVLAKQLGMPVIALTGKDGGKLATIADIEIRAPHSAFADRAQEIHIKVIHSLIMLIEQLTSHDK